MSLHYLLCNMPCVHMYDIRETGIAQNVCKKLYVELYRFIDIWIYRCSTARIGVCTREEHNGGWRDRSRETEKQCSLGHAWKKLLGLDVRDGVVVVVQVSRGCIGMGGRIAQCRWEIERSYYTHVMAGKNRLFGKFTFWIRSPGKGYLTFL